MVTLRKHLGKKTVAMTGLGLALLGSGLLVAALQSPIQPKPVPVKISHSTNSTFTAFSAPILPVLKAVGKANSEPTAEPAGCTSQPLQAGRLTSSDSIIRGLAGNAEQACQATIFGGAMRFFEPDPDAASEWQADVLAETARLKMRSVVVLETGSWNFATIANGGHDTQLKRYFAELKSAGVTAEQLGTLVVCGEPFVGERPGATPENTIECIRHFVQAARASFPDAQVSAMLDEAEITTMQPVLSQLSATGINSVGWQMFSNGQAIGFDGDRPDISFFMEAGRLKSAIAASGISNIWINTGVTASDKNTGASYTAAQRQAIAAAMLTELKQLPPLSFVNLFMENKSNQAEGRDFSVSKDAAGWLETFVQGLPAGTSLYGFDVAD